MAFIDLLFFYFLFLTFNQSKSSQYTGHIFSIAHPITFSSQYSFLIQYCLHFQHSLTIVSCVYDILSVIEANWDTSPMHHHHIVKQREISTNEIGPNVIRIVKYFIRSNFIQLVVHSQKYVVTRISCNFMGPRIRGFQNLSNCLFA